MQLFKADHLSQMAILEMEKWRMKEMCGSGLSSCMVTKDIVYWQM